MNWDSTDTGLLLAALAGIHQDVQSTKDLIRRGGDETNPLLGKKPSGQELDKSGLTTALLGGGAIAALPEHLRKPALGAWAGLESGLAYKNAHVNAKEKPTDLAHSHLEGPLMMALAGGLLGSVLDDSSAIGHAFRGLSLGAVDDGKQTVPALAYTKNF